MVAIKFNGVRKIPGRPTIVEGIEGRRHVNNKILRALESSQKSIGGYNSYSTYTSSPDGMNWDEEVNKLGMEIAGTYEVEEAAETFQWNPTAETSEADAQFQDDSQVQNDSQEQYSYTYEEEEPANQSMNEYAESFITEQTNTIPEQIDAVENQANTIEVQNYTEQQQTNTIQDRNRNVVDFAEDSEDETTSEMPQAALQPCEEGFEIGPVLRACIEETNSFPIVTEHQLRCESTEPLTEISDPIPADCDEIETDEYFDYPENGMSSDHPRTMEWLQEFEQSEARVQRNRTTILRVPTAGVVRSSRGTVELLVHADGRTFKPTYNKCGILIAVHCSDGYTLVKHRFSSEWSLVGPTGAAINEDAIIVVAFDKRGNLSYQSESGRLVTLCVDGNIVESA